MIADHTVARLVVQLVVRPLANCPDLSHDFATGGTINRTIGRRCHDWSCDPSPDTTIDRTIGHITHWLIVCPVAERHDWPYDRSHDTPIDRRAYERSSDAMIYRTIGRWSLPLVVRLPMTDLAIDVLQSLVIARRRARPTTKDQSQYATATGDRSRHCRSVVCWPNRKQSYDTESVRSGVTVALSLPGTIGPRPSFDLVATETYWNLWQIVERTKNWSQRSWGSR